MTEPSVSVIVPCYNGGRFLDGLLESLANQTLRDFEIIIVNDGSTEQSTLDKLAKLESAVRVVHQENRYLPGARNTGFRHARGQFVVPLDCDDRLEPSYLERTVAALKVAPDDVAFVYTHMRIVGMVAGVLHNHFNRFDQLFINRLPYCMLFRKSAWEAVGGYDESMRDGSEDWEFNVRLVGRGYRGAEIELPLFVYTVRPDGMLLSKSAHMQGTMWRRVRERNPTLYYWPELIKVWRGSGSGLLSALRAITLLTLVKILPEAWYNALFFRLIMIARARRVSRGEMSAVPISR